MNINSEPATTTSRPAIHKLATAAVAMLATFVATLTFHTAPAAATVYSPDGRDSVSSYVYCDAIGHQVWVRSNASFYFSSVTRNFFVARNGGTYYTLDGWKIPDNQLTNYSVSGIAGSRLSWYVRYSYTSNSWEYPPVYQWNGYTRQWVLQSSANCYV